MHYRHIIAYQLSGIFIQDNNSTGIPIDLQIPHTVARIVKTLDSLPIEVDQVDAIAKMLLDGLVGNSEAATPEERISNHVQNIRSTRNNALRDGNMSFLLIERSGNFSDFTIENEREFDTFSFTLCENPSKAIKAKFKSQLDGILTSLIIASEHLHNIKELFNKVFYVREDGKPLFCFRMDISAALSTSSPLAAEALLKLPKQARSLGRHQSLIDISRLLTKALLKENDPLLSFLSVWSGLEIFINKNFKEYETKLLSRLADGNPPLLPLRMHERIRSVMSDKYRLADKFSAIAAELAKLEANIDQLNFESIKLVRDKLLHGADVPITTFPIDDATRLLRKYLRLHLERNGA